VNPPAGAVPAGPARLRLFVAVWPPAGVVRQLEELPRPARPGIRWTRPEQWHVTMRFLGHCELEAAAEAFAACTGEACTAVMGPATDRLGRGVLQVPVAGLGELAAAVVQATAGVGRPPDSRPFHGHLTLARARGARDLADLVGQPAEATWPVTELTLVSSITGRGGSRYGVERRLQLRS